MARSQNEADILSQECASATLHKTSCTLTSMYDEALKPSGLLATQYIALVAIQKDQPATIGQLAETMVMDRTTLTRNLKPLEKSGLIVSGKGEDQRTHVVSLTLKGKDRNGESISTVAKGTNSRRNNIGTQEACAPAFRSERGCCPAPRELNFFNEDEYIYTFI